MKLNMFLLYVWIIEKDNKYSFNFFSIYSSFIVKNIKFYGNRMRVLIGFWKTFTSVGIIINNSVVWWVQWDEKCKKIIENI
jgi:hypothetical protein